MRDEKKADVKVAMRVEMKVEMTDEKKVAWTVVERADK